MFEFLTLIATSATAVSAIVIAKQANLIATQTNLIAKQANTISQTSMRIEADKILLDWGQRCTRVISDAVALRIVDEKHIEQSAFVEKRRALRRDLISLHDEGEILFKVTNVEQPPAALQAIKDASDTLNGKSFKAPTPNDYETQRQPQMKELRRCIRNLRNDLQNILAADWLHGAN